MLLCMAFCCRVPVAVIRPRLPAQRADRRAQIVTETFLFGGEIVTNCGSGSGLRFADIALDGSLDGILGGFWASSEHDDATCDGWLLPTAG